MKGVRRGEGRKRWVRRGQKEQGDVGEEGGVRERVNGGERGKKG